VNYEIEVVGDLDFVIGFSLSGIKGKTFSADKKEELSKYLSNMIKNKEKKLIILQNKLYQLLPDRLKNKISLSITPLVIVLGNKESDDIKFMIRKVFGVDIL